MPDISKQLSNTAFELQNLLRRYNAIHNAIFKFSCRKIFPFRFIFKAIDYSQLNNRASQLLFELENCNKYLSELIPKATPLIEEAARALSEYCTAIIKTVALLREITYQRYLKSENSGDYSIEKYNETCNQYDESIKKYLSIGKKLNKYL